MGYISTILDATMCLLWIVTYTLVLIGTIKYKHPLIAPATQVIIAPFEFAVLLSFVIGGRLDIDYISAAYLYWTVIEVAIIYVILKSGNVRSGRGCLYILSVCMMTCIMCYLVIIRGWTFFFSYFNTVVGEIIWLFYIFKKDYPMKPLALAAFITKFIADAVSIPVYFGKGIWLISLISVLLPALDWIFILVYFNRKRKKQ